MQTLGHAWRAAQARLEAAGLNAAPREGQQVVARVVGYEISALMRREDERLTEAQSAQLEQWLEKRLTGAPLAYVLGVQPFWNTDWQVGAGVLIPRPDSEILVQTVLEALPQNTTARIAEVGVGSGALLGSILLERPLVQGVGTDISRVALNYAQANFTHHGIEERAQLIETSVLAGVAGPFEVVFSNPPYIAEAEYTALEACVRDHEPKLALVGGGTEGTAFYEPVLREALAVLIPQGLLVVEIGHTQGPHIKALFEAAGLQQVAIVKDLAGRDRVVRGVVRGRKA